jgi:hypothetical protein
MMCIHSRAKLILRGPGHTRSPPYQLYWGPVYVLQVFYKDVGPKGLGQEKFNLQHESK